MTDKFFSKLIKSSLIISGLSLGALTVKHHKDSNKVLANVSDEFDSNSEILGSWIDPLYQHVIIENQPRWCIVGGITVSQNNQVSQYQFIADTKDLTILDLRKVN